jgi:4-amino-4-deoxy-L-arabinose transferase-like glycosyltransferase
MLSWCCCWWSPRTAWRAVQVASWQWLALVGVVMGTAFLTKMLQGFLVLPGFGMAYLLAAPTT